MVRDVEPPDPPDLTNRGIPADVDLSDASESLSELRREELEDVLRDGAWEEAFREWVSYTDLGDEEYRAVAAHDLFEGLDFYWDPSDGRLRAELPPLPPEMASSSTRSSLVRNELADLADTVLELLAESYLDWADGETEDTWSEETFSEDATGRD